MMNDKQMKEYEHKLEFINQHRYAEQLVSNKDGELVGAIYLYHPYDPTVEALKKMLEGVNTPISFDEAAEYDLDELVNIKLPGSTGGD